MALCVFERQSRNHLLPLLVSFVPNQLEHLYDRFIDRELFLIDLVRQVALAIALETGSAHDHTKDAFYTFVTCGKYGGVGVDGRPEFESICTDETNRHFSLEPHHPQFEHFRQMEWMESAVFHESDTETGREKGCCCRSLSPSHCTSLYVSVSLLLSSCLLVSDCVRIRVLE